MKVIEIKNNQLLLFYIKLFQTTIELLFNYYLKKLIKDNYIIEVKYIQLYWQFIYSIN